MGVSWAAGRSAADLGQRCGAPGAIAERVARGGWRCSFKNRTDKRRQRRPWRRQSRTKAHNEYCARSRPAELPLWITKAVVPAHLEIAHVRAEAIDSINELLSEHGARGLSDE
jgi:hypothetical protein